MMGGSAPCPRLEKHVAKSLYPVRLLRYWWAGQALAEESRRLGRPLRVLDLGCERGWLKYFTPPGAVEHWKGLDWNPKREDLRLAGYDEVVHANFDEMLPVDSASVDAVVSLHVFEHLPRPGATCAEVSRVLRSGGIFLAGAPTMPQVLARLREAWFRSQVKRGVIIPGGHINSISPSRWHRMVYDVGLEPEFVTGSHAIRLSGSFLESLRWWVRLNQIWGGLFPSLGSECYLRARRVPSWVESAPALRRRTRIPQVAWASMAAAAVLALVAGCALLFDHFHQDRSEIDRNIAAWLRSVQNGNDRFLVWYTWVGSELADESAVQITSPNGEKSSFADEGLEYHLIVSRSTLEQELKRPSSGMSNWSIVEQRSFDGENFVLLKFHARSAKVGA